MTDIHDVNKEICQLNFLEGRFERFDNGVRKFADETDRVGEEHFLPVRQDELTGGGVKSREEPVLGKHSCSREAVEKRRFSGVGVANQRGDRPVSAEAALALHGAVLAHAAQIAFQAGDAFLNAAAVDFKLCLAGAACSNSACLTRKVGPHSGETRQKILQLRKLDLEAALTSSRTSRENIENQLGAVQDLAAGQLFEIAPLRRGKLVVKNQRRHVLFSALPGNLLGLPLADIEGCRGLLQFLDNGIHHLRAGSGSELTQLRQGILNVPATHSLALEPNKNGLFLKPRICAWHHAAPRNSKARGGISCVSRRPVKSMISKLS